MSGVSDVERRDASSRMIVEALESGKPVLRGTPIVFNSPSRVLYDRYIGRFREIILPEAVDRTLRTAAPVKALWNHNSDIVLGNTMSRTLSLRKGTHGLEMEVHPPSWAGPQVETVQRGDVDGMSFAFGVADDGDYYEEGEDGIPTRFVRDMTFSEVSIVAFPAYPATNVSVSKRSVEVFRDTIGGMSLDLAGKLHKTRLAR